MVMTDPVADMLTRIRNANQMREEAVSIPASNMKRSILKVLQNEGYIEQVELIEDTKQGILKVFLKYFKGERVIKGIKRISKPGLRVYASSTHIPRVLNGLGVAIISTSKGIMTGKQAKNAEIGGEVVAYVW